MNNMNGSNDPYDREYKIFSPKSAVTAIEYLWKRGHLFTGSSSGTIAIVNAENAEVLIKWRAHKSEGIWSLSFALEQNFAFFSGRIFRTFFFLPSQISKSNLIFPYSLWQSRKWPLHQ